MLSQMPVKWLASSLPADANALDKQKHFPCFAGQSWQWDGVRFEVVHPSFDSYADAEIKDNNRSCVLHITSLYGSLLLVGDIEKLAEAELLGREPDKLVSDVLVVPHHGSKTSSTMDFITAVSPQVAIFTVGYLIVSVIPKPKYCAAISKLKVFCFVLTKMAQYCLIIQLVLLRLRVPS